MNKLRCAALLAVLGLSACSSMPGSDGAPKQGKVDYRAAAVQVPSLELPPDLTVPAADDRYRIPDVSNTATFSDYSKNGATAMPEQRASAGVLTEVKGVRLERNGIQRWLVVEDTPNNVWAVIKSFWQEAGLPIKTQDQSAGVMETDWVENRAKIPQGGIRSVLGKAFDNLYSSGERDMYRVRLERGKDGASTEIYVTHKGMQEMAAESKTGTGWQPRPSDPELEAIMLQRLMARFGGVPPVDMSGKATPKTSDKTLVQQNLPNGSKALVVNDTFESAWERVGQAIERAGYVLEDRDREKGEYFLKVVDAGGVMDKIQFWKSGGDKEQRYRVRVKNNGATCQVAVVDSRGASDSVSEKILSSIQKAFE